MRSDRDRGAHRGTARHRRRRNDASDRGSATAELAAAFPVVVLLLLAGLTGLAALSAKVRCSDAAGLAARAAARGEPASAAAQTAPSGATISVHREGDLVRATVTFRVRPAGLLPAFTVEEQAVAMVEPETEGP
jgi:hypothetical protein